MAESFRSISKERDVRSQVCLPTSSALNANALLSHKVITHHTRHQSNCIQRVGVTSHLIAAIGLLFE